MGTYVPVHAVEPAFDWNKTLGQMYDNDNTRQLMQERGQIMRDRDLTYQQGQQAWKDQQAVRQAYLDNAPQPAPNAAPARPVLHRLDGSTPLGATQAAGPDGAAPQAAAQPQPGQQMTPGPQMGQPQAQQTGFNQQGFEDQVRRTAPTLYNGIVKNRMDLQKELLEQQKTQLANHKALIDYGGQLANGITDQTSYAQNTQKMLAAGVLQPGEAPPVYDPKVVQQWQAAGQTATERLESVQKAVDAAEKSQHDAATEEDSARQRDEQQRYHTMEGKHWSQQQATENMRTGIEGQRLKMDLQKNAMDQQVMGGGASGEEFLQGLPPNIQASVKAIAAGDTAMPSSRSGAGALVREAVLRYDPTFTDSRYLTKKSFKTGNDAQSVTQLATVMEHLENSAANSKKVGWAPGMGSALQTPNEASLMKDIQLSSEEVGKLIKNGVLTDSASHGLQSGLNSSRESVRAAAFQTLTELMSSKVQAIFQKYKTGTGSELPVSTYFDKPTQERLQRFGIVKPSTAAAGDQPPPGARIRDYTQLGK